MLEVTAKNPSKMFDERAENIVRSAPNRPNLLIAGMSKCGTTSLYAHLQRHPNVFLTDPKELNYFMDDYGVRDPSEYIAHFDGANRARIRGEASASYISAPEAPQRVAAALGLDVRLIFMLRNPVDMAYSLWSHIRRTGVEGLSFPEALAAEERRLSDPDFGRSIKGTWPMNGLYRVRADYAHQVKRWINVFPRERIHFIAFERFSADPASVFRDVLEFLELEALELPALERVNPASAPRSLLLQRALSGRWPGKALLKGLPTSIRGPLKSAIRQANQKVRENPPLDLELRRSLWLDLKESAAETDHLTGLDIFDTWDRKNA